jgi:hypothetical protein
VLTNEAEKLTIRRGFPTNSEELIENSNSQGFSKFTASQRMIFPHFIQQ